MRVVKEVWMLGNVFGDYMCGQNTQTPKLYVTETSATSSADYYHIHHTQGRLIYKPIKAYIVIEDNDENTSNTGLSS